MIYKITLIAKISFLLMLFFIQHVWAQNPHHINQSSYDLSCKKCHLEDPFQTGGLLSKDGDFDEICLSCHQPPNKLPLISCLRAVKAETTLILQGQIPDIALKVKDERISCLSCHKVHIKEDKSTLRPDYFFFLKQSERISPHKSNILCIFCHIKEPQSKDDPLNLKFDADRVLICTQCHNNSIARADNHPVNIIPSEGKGINVNKEIFVLYDGKVACLTCHDIKCLIEEQRYPKFFRGGPYKERVDACLMCHTKENYKSVNPHEQFDDKGMIRIDRCLYCHIINAIPLD